MATSIRIRDHVRSVIDPDGAVLLDLKQGKYFSLSAVGAEIWSGFEAGLTLAQVDALLRGSYDVPGEMLRQDLKDFVEHLKREELVDVSC